jgi:tRNA dimethylallyltransferase
MLRTEPRPVVIAGPTASGKSAVALALAERDGGCIINADALQVYDCWRVLTARPDGRDLARAPHRLYGHVSCATARYSVGAWLRDVEAAIDDARRAGLRPIIVGGTGLYLTSLTAGLADIPAIPPEVRARSQRMLEAGEASLMLATLEREDPATVRSIDIRNPMRVQRAWEVLAATGRGLASWHGTAHPAPLPEDAIVRAVVSVETPLLNNRIQSRFHKMIEHGALDEVRGFLRAGGDWRHPAAAAIGARELAGYLGGELDLDAAVAAAIAQTRRFAKRQRTWFRNKMPGWPRIGPDSLTDILPE